MAWISISTDDVKTRITGDELEALQEAALATGQTDPLPEIIIGVVKEVRGYVAACAKNTLGTGDTIPEGLLHTALAMIRFRLATRLPEAGLLDENRKDENDKAIRLLENVAACKFAVEQPTTATTEEISAPSPKTTAKDREFTRESQDGI